MAKMVIFIGGKIEYWNDKMFVIMKKNKKIKEIENYELEYLKHNNEIYCVNGKCFCDTEFFCKCSKI